MTTGGSTGEIEFAERVGVPIQNVALLAPALSTTLSSVEIEGGTFVSSSIFGVPNPYLPGGGIVQVVGGRLRMRGGEILRGTIMPPSPLAGPEGLSGSSLSAVAAEVEIAGGNFDAAPVLLAGSRARITGGRFGAGLVVSNLLPIGALGIATPARCYEIRGGSFSSIGINGADPVFLVGVFNLPPGPVTSPSPGHGRFPPSPPLALSGVLEDGSSIQASLTAPPGTNVTLAPPGAAGCGS